MSGHRHRGRAYDPSSSSVSLADRAGKDGKTRLRRGEGRETAVFSTALSSGSALINIVDLTATIKRVRRFDKPG